MCSRICGISTKEKGKAVETVSFSFSIFMITEDWRIMELSKQAKKHIMQILAFAILLYCGIEHFDVVIHVVRFVLGIIMPFIVGGVIAFIFIINLLPFLGVFFIPVIIGVILYFLRKNKK